MPVSNCLKVTEVPMSEFLPMIPDLECFPEYENPPQIVPGRPAREWMEATTERFAYRCTPLAIANSSGWEMVLPQNITVHWNGGNLVSDMLVVGDDPRTPCDHVGGSVFGHGVVTFHPGYLFRTSPGWALSVRGAPNTIKDGIAPLEGLVETDWLPFTFTMNWRMTRPGTVYFKKGEPFCFIQPVPHAALDQIEPKIRGFGDHAKLKESYDYWRQARIDFNERLAKLEPEAVKEAWQRNYVKGHDPSGNFPPEFHLSKRLLNTPK